jgi:hypothetical protein
MKERKKRTLPQQGSLVPHLCPQCASKAAKNCEEADDAHDSLEYAIKSHRSLEHAAKEAAHALDDATDALQLATDWLHEATVHVRQKDMRDAKCCNRIRALMRRMRVHT